MANSCVSHVALALRFCEVFELCIPLTCCWIMCSDVASGWEVHAYPRGEHRYSDADGLEFRSVTRYRCCGADTSTGTLSTASSFLAASTTYSGQSLLRPLRKRHGARVR